MKKILLCISFIFLFNVQGVKADIKGVLEKNVIDGYYYVMENNSYYHSDMFPFYEIDGNVVYCIEPIDSINTYNYVGKYEYLNFLYDDSVSLKIELIGYYGYNNFEHNTINYRLATQELIWETISNKEVDFYDAKYGYGRLIDVSKEKEEIMSLVSNHNIKPSFDNINISGNVNDEIILEDLNNVLNGYEVYNDGGNFVEIKDNKLIVKILNVNDLQIELKRKKYDELKTIVFIGDDKPSKKFGLFRNGEDIISRINIDILTKKIKIKFTNNEDDKDIEGMKFKIKNIDTNEYLCENNDCVFEIDDSGEVLINNIYNGRFKFEHVRDNEFVINNNFTLFEVSNNTYNNEIYVVSLDRVVIDVPDTLLNEYDIYFCVGLVFIIIGFGLYIYGKSNKKNKI